MNTPHIVRPTKKARKRLRNYWLNEKTFIDAHSAKGATSALVWVELEGGPDSEVMLPSGPYDEDFFAFERWLDQHG